MLDENLFMLYRFSMLLILLLAACNLQQAPPTTPTAEGPPEITPPTTQPTRITPERPNNLPTLLPTPTQMNLITTAPPGPTPLNFESGTPGPTLDAALADDRYELEAGANSTRGINFEVTVTQGAVHMTMQGPDGILWQRTFTNSETGRDEVTITQGGTYEILIDRENFDGNYALSWD